jgi:hypothetical protein
MRRPFANSRPALILRRWRGRFGIFAPRVAVRTHVPWHWWAISALAVLAVSILVADRVYDAGRRFAGFDRSVSEQELETLRGKAAGLEKELLRLRGLADASESKLQIELAAEQQLAHQVKSLEDENARLKEDLSVFESLASAEGQDGHLSINRLRIEADGGVANQYNYRMLLAMQGSNKAREFKGSLQLAVTLQQQGHNVMMFLPQTAEQNSQQYNVNFKNFHRLDGSFLIPAGARIKSVEVRLLQDGALKASKSITL